METQTLKKCFISQRYFNEGGLRKVEMTYYKRKPEDTYTLETSADETLIGTTQVYLVYSPLTTFVLAEAILRNEDLTLARPQRIYVSDMEVPYEWAAGKDYYHGWKHVQGKFYRKGDVWLVVDAPQLSMVAGAGYREEELAFVEQNKIQEAKVILINNTSLGNGWTKLNF